MPLPNLASLRRDYEWDAIVATGEEFWVNFGRGDFWEADLDPLILAR